MHLLLNVNHVMNQYAVLIVMSHLLIIKLKIDSNVIYVNILFLHLVLVQTVEVRTLKKIGYGTQKIEEELEKQYPEAHIIRFDFDTTRNKNTHLKLLKDFEEHKADIMLGTQMIAKGLDFSNVTFVGVLMADLSLMVPDFRASERTFQLLCQVAGRSGRGENREQL